jgi:hypothetical protein
MTEDGVSGYCFSLRLQFFEHSGGAIEAAQTEETETIDADLERTLSLSWSPEIYENMINEDRIDLEAFSKNWRFVPEQDTGTAHLFISDVDKTFTYSAIKKTGARQWRFEGANLQMTQRSDRVLLVQYNEPGGAARSLLFVNFNVSIDDIITQEIGRREELYNRIFAQGPEFSSTNYGTLTLGKNGSFTWSGYDFLIPQVLSSSAMGTGSISLDIFPGRDLAPRYSGAFTMRFNSITNKPVIARFMYSIENSALRLEYAGDQLMDGNTIIRRSASPLIIYFQASPQAVNG